MNIKTVSSIEFLKWLRRMGEAVLDAVFPKRCVLCRRVIDPKTETGLCELCRWQDFVNEQPMEDSKIVRCGFVYEDQLQQAIYRLKYEGCRAYGQFFARWMYEEGAEWAAKMDFDRVVAVPLAKKRLKNRGYNQAEVMARELARLCRVPYGELLERVKDTRPQRGLSEELRRQNVSRAFAARECEVVPRRICLVDDIYTTGSTMTECIRVLREKWPGVEVYCWVLARRNIERL